ncbi:hypothetical protein A0H76_3025, partial [Hepatospora eriocheir]
MNKIFWEMLNGILLVSVEMLFPLKEVQAEQIYSKMAVSSESEHASRIGLNILKKGGNAVDAAIATAIAIG